MRPDLTVIDEIIARVLDDTITDTQAVAQLRHRGYDTTIEQVRVAADDLETRDGLIDGSIDPVWWLEGWSGKVGGARDYAVSLAEETYDDALGSILTTRRHLAAAR